MITPKRTKETRSPKRGKGDADRDENGRYLPGHAIPGPGNPYGQRVAAMRAALLSAVSAQDIKDMACAMVRAAKDGDAACFRVLAPYLFGKPIDSEDAPEDAKKLGPLYVEFTRWLRPDGTEITDRDPDYPTELDRSRYDALRQQYENVVQFDARMANA
jgi:hypothetical protein